MYRKIENTFNSIYDLYEKKKNNLTINLKTMIFFLLKVPCV
jgi:hypothetical protein